MKFVRYQAISGSSAKMHYVILHEIMAMILQQFRRNTWEFAHIHFSGGEGQRGIEWVANS